MAAWMARPTSVFMWLPFENGAASLGGQGITATGGTSELRLLARCLRRYRRCHLMDRATVYGTIVGLAAEVAPSVKFLSASACLRRLAGEPAAPAPDRFTFLVSP
jgi:hypothetical protein